MFSESTIEAFGLVATIVVLVVVVLIILFIGAEHKWKKKDSRSAKLAAIGLLIAIIVISASTAVVYVMIEEQGTQYEYDYTATVDGGNVGGVVHIPISLNGELQGELEVTSGDGTLSIVDTEHGRALRLEFLGPVTVEGRIIKDHRIDDWEPTMLNESWDAIAWSNLEREGVGNGTVVLDWTLWSHPLPGHNEVYWMDATLKNGWNTYQVHHKIE